MPHTLARNSVPVFTRSNHVVWSVDRERRFTSFFGGGLDRIQTRVIGESIDELHRDRPDLLDMFDRLFRGQMVHEVCEFDGTLWMVEGAPVCGPDGAIMGCAGVSFALIQPEDREPPRQRWRVADLPAGHHPIQNGDVFVKLDGAEGVGSGRRWSDSEFLNLRMRYGRYLKPVEATSPSEPPSLPPRRLELLP